MFGVVQAAVMYAYVCFSAPPHRNSSGPDHIQPIVNVLVIVLRMYGSVLFETFETGSTIHTPAVPVSSGGVLKAGHLTCLHNTESKRTMSGECESGGLVLAWNFTVSSEAS